MAGRLRAPADPLPVLAAGSAAALLGLLAGIDPLLAVAASFAVAFFFLAFASLSVGIVAFSVLTFLELAPAVGGPALSFTKVAGLALALSWIAVVTSDPDSRRLVFNQHPALTAAAGLFLAWMVLSLLWAENSDSVYDVLLRYGLNIALIPIVFTGIRERRHLLWLAGSFSAGATAAALYGLAVVPSSSEAVTSTTSAGELDRVAGTVGDPNVLASILVIGVVVSCALALVRSVGPLGRLAAGGAAGICLLGIFVTLSRGGIVALLAAGVTAIIFSGPRFRAQVATASATVALVGVLWFTLFAPEAAVERLTTADGGTGRTDIWKVGWRMVEDSPIHGIGAGNFADASIHFLLVEPGAIERDEFIVDQPTLAHNLYLQILAEIGLIGLALFLGIVIASIVSSVRAAWAFQRSGHDGAELIARAIVIAIISVLAADFFLSNEFDKRLWLMIALGPAMLQIARSDTGGETTR